MSQFTPTAEQQLIIDYVKMTSDNIIIHALAGAAKTSTLVLIAKALPGTPMLCLAFNKKIQLEMKERLPGNCEAMTLNSIGHRVWSQAIGKRLVIDDKKTYEIVRTVIDELADHQKNEAYSIMADTIQAVNAGKTCGYVPTGMFSQAKPIMDDEEFFAWLDEEPSPLMEDLIRECTKRSIELAMQGQCDYNDQIFMPTIFWGQFPNYPLVLIDEAQDLSALNHVMLRKIARKRLIAVGDPNQSIYGFRGAHENSMKLLREQFKMVRMDLTVSFRCPIAVVQEARWRAPAMAYPDWAKEGSVRHLTEWRVTDIPNSAAIICRNNAPLFTCAVALIKAGQFPEIVGNDIGKALLKIMKKLGLETLTQPEAFTALEEWKAAKLAKSRNPGTVTDQAECISIFIEEGKTLGGAIAYAEHLLARSGNIKLMTGHKSKGLEFEDVFILDRFLIRKDASQDKNLLYVMQTRAKSSLTYILNEGFKAA